YPCAAYGRARLASGWGSALPVGTFTRGLLREVSVMTYMASSSPRLRLAHVQVPGRKGAGKLARVGEGWCGRRHGRHVAHSQRTDGGGEDGARAAFASVDGSAPRGDSSQDHLEARVGRVAVFRFAHGGEATAPRSEVGEAVRAQASQR